LASSDRRRENLQIAASVNQSQTGEVLAMLGGRGDGRGGYNRALRAHRPVGSLIKPFIYLTAIEQQGLHLASELNDASVRLELANGDIWEPHNFDEKLHGSVPAVRALADSLNLATVQLGLQVGVAQVADRIGELSSRPTPPAYPSLLLGALEMNVLEVGELYGSLASGGFYARPKTVISVLDETGTPLSRYLLQTRQVVKPLVITQINSMLQTAMARGTGRSSPLGRSGVAGKTGTSNGFRDSWFAGFDDQLLTVIWVGNDDNSATGLTGASGALRVWDAFMQTVGVQPMLPLESAQLPTQTIEYASGLLANARCSDISELIVVPLPEHLQLSTKPGCGGARFGDRIRKWLTRD
jgi:penicillin-binding protein 1B